MEGQIAFATLLRRLRHLELEAVPLVWRENSGLRGLTALPVTFGDPRAPRDPDHSEPAQAAPLSLSGGKGDGARAESFGH
jgi:hypothetical protein